MIFVGLVGMRPQKVLAADQKPGPKKGYWQWNFKIYTLPVIETKSMLL